MKKLCEDLVIPKYATNSLKGFYRFITLLIRQEAKNNNALSKELTGGWYVVFSIAQNFKNNNEYFFFPQYIINSSNGKPTAFTENSIAEQIKRTPKENTFTIDASDIDSTGDSAYKILRDLDDKFSPKYRLMLGFWITIAYSFLDKSHQTIAAFPLIYGDIDHSEVDGRMFIGQGGACIESLDYIYHDLLGYSTKLEDIKEYTLDDISEIVHKIINFFTNRICTFFVDCLNDSIEGALNDRYWKAEYLKPNVEEYLDGYRYQELIENLNFHELFDHVYKES